MQNSLELMDIVQIVVLCVLIVFPAGFYLGRRFYSVKAFYRLGGIFHVGIKDEGSFKKFMDK